MTLLHHCSYWLSICSNVPVPLDPFSHEPELKAVMCSVAVGKLMELHGEGGAGSTAKATGDDTGAKVERADGYEPPIQETV